MISNNIHDGVHFLNGKGKYLMRAYAGHLGDFDISYELIYPENDWILSIFNGSREYYSAYEIYDCLDRIIKESNQENPKDWTLIKHIVYRKKKVWLYGQIALYSKTIGLKCFQYQYRADAEPPDYCEMDEFDEIPRKQFKFKSAIRHII